MGYGYQRLVVLTLIVGVIVLVPSHVAVAQADNASVAARLARLERSLENRGLLDLLQQVETLQREVERLRGTIEEQSYTIDQLRQTQRDTYVDIDQRLSTIEGGVRSPSMGITAGNAPPLTTLQTSPTDVIAGTPAPQSSLQVETTGQPTVTTTLPATTEPTLVDDDANSQTAPAGTAPVAIVTPPLGLSPTTPTTDNEASENAYREAFSLLKAGQYDESIVAFSEFLTSFPNSQYADNAQYWLGETHYVKRDFEPAIVEYRKLLETFPNSKKQSHAMLKIGYSYHELGKVDQARAVLEDLRNRFAGSAAARLAAERIQRIASQQTP